MAFEDGAVLGEVLSRLPNDPSISKTSPEYLAEKRHALAVFEKCRKERTQMVVKRGNTQQYLYHLHDGPEQEDRDRKMQMVPTPEGECLAWRDPGLAPKLLGYDHIADVSEELIICHGENVLTGAGKPQLECSYRDNSRTRGTGSIAVMRIRNKQKRLVIF
jgi:salicylate hydroxylase